MGFWVRRDSTEVRSPVGSNPWAFRSPDDLDVFTFFYVNGPWTRINTANNSNATINSGTWGTGWTHLAATYNGANYRLFINGTFQAQVAATGDVLRTFGADRNWFIGRRGNYPQGSPDSWSWFGDIAEFSIWNAVLTDAELVSLAKGFTSSRVRPQSLLTYNRLVRSLADAKGRSTASGTTVAASHPVAYG